MNITPTTSKTNNTDQLKIPKPIVKKSKITTELDFQSPSPSRLPNLDSKFRSPRKTVTDRESTKTTFFFTYNRYSPLKIMITNQNETISNVFKNSTSNNTNNFEFYT